MGWQGPDPDHCCLHLGVALLCGVLLVVVALASFLQFGLLLQMHGFAHLQMLCGKVTAELVAIQELGMRAVTGAWDFLLLNEGTLYKAHKT